MVDRDSNVEMRSIEIMMSGEGLRTMEQPRLTVSFVDYDHLACEVYT